MKWIGIITLLLLMSSCRKSAEPSLSVAPGQLRGTWSTGTTSEPYQRWTFDDRFMYLTADRSTDCQAVDNASFYTYTIEHNQLRLRFVGITNGLFPIPDLLFRIEAITNDQLTVVSANEKRLGFTKCP